MKITSQQIETGMIAASYIMAIAALAFVAVRGWQTFKLVTGGAA